MRDTSSTKLNDDDGAWSEIEQLVAETTDLARQPMSHRDFYVELLHRLMLATGAESSAAWTTAAEGLRLEYRTNAKATQPLDERATLAMQATLSTIAERGDSQVIAPGAATTDAIENPTGHVLIACPLEIDDQTVAVLEVLQSDSASPQELRSVQELVSIFADVARDFHRDRQLRELRTRQQAWTELNTFATQVHQSLDWRRTCYVVANEAARVTGCDRISVLSRGRAIAVSGIDSVNRRSNTTRVLESLAKVVERAGEAMWFPNEDESFPPQVTQRLEDYHDQTHVRSVAVVPLRSASGNAHQRRLGVLVFERFDGSPWTNAQRRRIESVCQHSASAMQNAAELSSLPLLWVSRVAQSLLWPLGLRQLPKTLLIVAALIGAIVSLCLVPGDFVIEGKGELQPVVRRHLFAPADAVIEQLHVDHSDKVTAGQVLLELRHADLDLKVAKVLGDLQTSQKQFETVHARRLNFARLNSDDSTEFDDLTSEEEKLKTMIASLSEQKEILMRQVAVLTLTSQVNGEVLTWGLEEQLKSRAVRRGERLITVGETDGPWMLEMWIADHDVEHVLTAQDGTEGLDVSFVLANQSGEAYEGRVDRIGMTTETTADGRPSVRVVVAFDKEQRSGLRPGTTAFAKIHCGRRPIGYIWFRELFEVVRTRLLF